MGGTYPVGTIDNPVEYQFSLTKQVTLSAEGYDDITVTLDFYSDWFSYWLSSNQCPQLYETRYGQKTAKTAWTSGGVIDGSGLDFTVSASAEQVSVIVNKYIVDESGNALLVKSETSMNHL